ncbi:cell division cycle protein 27 homolog [Meleagris gallopavo]|uniref:cell division cycle protein 27 homolog n=1 Tax=Meleagris gallopavo TaxID=9103 RepID=UPI0012AB59E8|nr:cell division cycle protein 27 homolog [Meleagris gallopavo]
MVFSLSHLKAAIWQALNHYAYRDAVFLAERLYAEVHSEEALFLLATCYYRSGKAYKAYRLLKGHSCTTPQCKYLLAKCCVDLSNRVKTLDCQCCEPCNPFKPLVF